MNHINESQLVRQVGLALFKATHYRLSERANLWKSETAGYDDKEGRHP